ncbi:MAG: hypothetical protein ACI8U0_002740 [Flavobacteriales bacterium]|jgi:hypothetical protein
MSIMTKFYVLLLALLSTVSSVYPQQENDIKSILEACLNINELQEYYHPELQNRVPIIIQDDELVTEVKGIIMFEKEVEFWLLEDLFFQGVNAYIEILNFEYDQDKASVKFLYPVEGIMIEATLSKVQDQWRIQESKISEQ